MRLAHGRAAFPPLCVSARSSGLRQSGAPRPGMSRFNEAPGAGCRNWRRLPAGVARFSGESDDVQHVAQHSCARPGGRVCHSGRPEGGGQSELRRAAGCPCRGTPFEAGPSAALHRAQGVHYFEPSGAHGGDESAQQAHGRAEAQGEQHDARREAEAEGQLGKCLKVHSGDGEQL